MMCWMGTRSWTFSAWTVSICTVISAGCRSAASSCSSLNIAATRSRPLRADHIGVCAGAVGHAAVADDVVHHDGPPGPGEAQSPGEIGLVIGLVGVDEGEVEAGRAGGGGQGRQRGPGPPDD